MDGPHHVSELLLVEDNPGDVRLTKEMVKESELEPSLRIISDGSDAIDLLRQRGEDRNASPPDAILLDSHLPRVDGEEGYERLPSSFSRDRNERRIVNWSIPKIWWTRA